MRRLVFVTVVAVSVGSATLACAAALGGIVTGRAQAGDAAIAVCDPNGFTVSYTTVGGNVTSATVSDIADPGCEGGDLSVTVTNSAADNIAAGGPSVIATDGDTSPNSLTVSVSPQPAAEQVAGVNVAVVGP